MFCIRPLCDRPAEAVGQISDKRTGRGAGPDLLAYKLPVLTKVCCTLASISNCAFNGA